MVNEKQLIDANELLLNIRTTIVRSKHKYGNNPIISSVLDGFDELVMGKVRNAPTVDAVEVVHGFWEAEPPYFLEHCSVCDYCPDKEINHNYKYCPNCGADMRGGGDA